MATGSQQQYTSKACKEKTTYRLASEYGCTYINHWKRGFKPYKDVTQKGFELKARCKLVEFEPTLQEPEFRKLLAQSGCNLVRF